MFSCSSWPPFPPPGQAPSTLHAALEAVKVAHVYDVTPLLSRAQDAVVGLISLANAVLVWRYAADHLPFPEGDIIAYHAFAHVRDNFEALACRSTELKNLSDSSMELLVSRNDLVVQSEDTVLQAVLTRIKSNSPGAKYATRCAWLGHIRWGCLSREKMAESVHQVLSKGRPANDTDKSWPALYTAGLLEALCSHVDNGMALLHPSNVPRGGADVHQLMVVAEGDSCAKVSSTLVVGADSWQLCSKMGEKSGSQPQIESLTLQRLPGRAPVANDAGVAPPAVVRVSVKLFFSDLRHNPSRKVLYNTTSQRSCDLFDDTYDEYEYCDRRAAVKDVLLRHQQSPNAAAPVAEVDLTPALVNSLSQRAHFGRSLFCDGRLGVGVAFSLNPVTEPDL